MDSFKIFLSHISLSLVADLEAAKLMLFENYWKRNICLCDVFDVFGFSAVIHGDSLIPCCSFRRAFTPTTLECLGMPSNDPFLAEDHQWGPVVQVIADSELNLEKLDVMNSFFGKIWDPFTALRVHKSALLIIPAMQMSLMGSTTTRCCCSLLNHCSCFPKVYKDRIR